MRHIGFCMKVLMVVVALALAAGEVNANTNMKPVAGLSQEVSIGEIPLQGRYAVSAAIGMDLDAFHITTAGTYYETVNPSQSLTARFSSGGVAVSIGSHDLGLLIRSCGYSEDLKPVDSGRPEIVKTHLKYHRGDFDRMVCERSLRSSAGFTLEATPSDRGDTGPITLSLDLHGDLLVEVDQNRKGLILKGAYGMVGRHRRGWR